MLMTRQVREAEVIRNCGGAACGQESYACAVALAESFDEDDGIGLKARCLRYLTAGFATLVVNVISSERSSNRAGQEFVKDVQVLEDIQKALG